MRFKQATIYTFIKDETGVNFFPSFYLLDIISQNNAFHTICYIRMHVIWRCIIRNKKKALTQN